MLRRIDPVLLMLLFDVLSELGAPAEVELIKIADRTKGEIMDTKIVEARRLNDLFRSLDAHHSTPMLGKPTGGMTKTRPDVEHAGDTGIVKHALPKQRNVRTRITDRTNLAPAEITVFDYQVHQSALSFAQHSSH